jgi:hypothetical protein
VTSRRERPAVSLSALTTEFIAHRRSGEILADLLPVQTKKLTYRIFLLPRTPARLP